jgi:tetratricopeptide (TPR) repeat protein
MNDIEEIEERKRRMVERLGGSSLLVFVFDHWFGVFALVFLLALIFLGLVIPPIWRQTPADFVPVIKVSGVDLWQASSLRRTAMREAAAGRPSEAIQAWRSAINNSPADLSLLRSGLGYVASLRNPPKEHLEFAANYAIWLLRLGGTNSADADLALRLMSRYGMENYVVKLGQRVEDRLGPESARLLVRSYFGTGDIQSFERLWAARESQFTNDVELVLHHEAWKANWGPPATLQAGRESLRAAQADPKLRTLALRLQLRVSYAMRDEVGFGAALQRLEEDHDAKVSDHVMHWLLMSALGRKEQAQQLARSFGASPESPSDVQILGSALVSLGLHQEATAFLDQHLKRFGYEPDLWVLQANSLVSQKQWTELRGLAFAIRNELRLQGALDGYSQYLEALAEVNLDRPEAARVAADRLSRTPLPSPELTRHMAQQMRAIGFPEVSLTLLRAIEAGYKNDPTYWFDRAVAAVFSNDLTELVASADRAYALNPSDLSIVNNYAASLVLTRRRPEQAVALTLQVLKARPGDIDSELNHALALLQSTRLSDAAAVLRGMNTLSLGLAETAVYQMAWFEYHMGMKDWHSARVDYAKIDSRRLLGAQAAWLEEKFKTIPRD